MTQSAKVLLSIAGAVLPISVVGLLVFYGLFTPVTSSGPGPDSETTGSQGGAGLPNPASVYCEEQGGTAEARTAADGSQ